MNEEANNSQFPDAGKVLFATCPFCGKEISAIRGQRPKQRVCIECGAEGPVANTREEADIRWNHRVPEPGTSIIRWTRYGDRKPDNKSRQYIRSVSGVAMTWVPNGEIPDNCWSDDDLWAYLPGPPEAAQ